MFQLHISLLGGFSVRMQAGERYEPPPQRTQELLTYLLLNYKAPQSRERLLHLLWGEKSAETARKSLRQTLWQLKRHLPPIADILIVEPETLQVALTQHVNVDFLQLVTAFETVQGIAARQVTTAHVGVMREAVAQYKGDLLPDCYADWCIFERERLQMIYLLLLDKLTAHSFVYAQYEQGISYATQILRYDAANEGTHCRLMQLLAAAGQRSAAIRQYHRCVDTLRNELDVAPTAYTRRLFEQICTGTNVVLGDSVRGQVEFRPISPPPISTASHLTHLQQIEATINQLQMQLKACIAAVQEEETTPSRK